jgi:hypothetical protein
VLREDAKRIQVHVVVHRQTGGQRRIYLAVDLTELAISLERLCLRGGDMFFAHLVLKALALSLSRAGELHLRTICRSLSLLGNAKRGILFRYGLSQTSS